MAIEEHFDKEILEQQKRRLGPIIKGEGFVLSSDYDIFSPAGAAMRNALNVNVRAVRKGKVLKDQELNKQKRIAIGLYRGLAQGDLKASDIFDVEQTGKYLALISFFNAGHALSNSNVHFYFNPITYKFEPVPMELDFFSPIANKEISYLGTYKYHLFTELFALVITDPKIRASFKKYSIILDDYVKENINKLKKEEQKYLDILRSEFAFLPKMNWGFFTIPNKDKLELIKNDSFFASPKEKNSKIIFSYDADKKIDPVAYQYIVREGNKVFLEFANTITEPVEVHSLHICYMDFNSDQEICETLDKNNQKYEVKFPIKLPAARDIGSNSPYLELLLKPQIKRVYLKDFSALRYISSSGKVKVPWQEKYYDITNIEGYDNYFPMLSSHPLESMSLDDLLAKYDFMKLSSDGRFIELSRGEYDIGENIIFPEGYGVRIYGGTKLNMSEDVLLVIKGVSEFLGDANNPIIFTSKDQGKRWHGLAQFKGNYYGGGSKSRWNYVIFKDLDYNEVGDWRVTGSVSVYESDIDMDYIQINDSIAEDGLNIVRSEVDIDGLYVIGSRSDGFDCDVCVGEVRNSRFSNIGGDGFDISDSNLRLMNSRFSYIRDKGVSVGERSRADISKILVEHVGSGLVSKDESMVMVEDSIFKSVEYSILMSYRKKGIYSGISVVEGNNIEYEQRGKDDILCQKGGGVIILSGEDVKCRKLDVEELYDGYMKK